MAEKLEKMLRDWEEEGIRVTEVAFYDYSKVDSIDTLPEKSVLRLHPYPQDDCCPDCELCYKCPHACHMVQHIQAKECPQNCYETCWAEHPWVFKRKKEA